MKRYVYVPINLLNKNQDILDDANRISKLAKLPIRIGQEKEFPNIKDIEIICVPEKKSVFFDEKVKCNFLQIIKYENDFVNFTKNTQCIVEHNNTKIILFPTVAEKHCVRFNARFDIIDTYKFYIINDNSIISDEYFFEVV